MRNETLFGIAPPVKFGLPEARNIWMCRLLARK